MCTLNYTDKIFFKMMFHMKYVSFHLYARVPFNFAETYPFIFEFWMKMNENELSDK